MYTTEITSHQVMLGMLLGPMMRSRETPVVHFALDHFDIGSGTFRYIAHSKTELISLAVYCNREDVVRVVEKIDTKMYDMSTLMERACLISVVVADFIFDHTDADSHYIDIYAFTRAGKNLQAIMWMVEKFFTNKYDYKRFTDFGIIERLRCIECTKSALWIERYVEDCIAKIEQQKT